VTAAPRALAADLNDGLKRLKMAAMRRLAPELLITAKTQRWNPEEFLRTLVEAEIAARDASNARTRRRQAGFPVTKTLAEYDLAVSSVPRPTFDYLGSLEWIRAAENLCLIGPAGTGKSHLLLALGDAAVDAGHRVRYLPAAELVETLYRGLADNSVGRVIDTLLRNELIIVDELGFAPLDDTGAQLLFRFVAAAYERRSLGRASHWPFESWSRFLPEHTTAVSMTAKATVCAKPETKEEPRSTNIRNNPRSGDFQLATDGDRHLAIDIGGVSPHQDAGWGRRDSGPGRKRSERRSLNQRMLRPMLP
jgi:DNA replication protein DnaC